jgi:acyl-CoA reductase-like NAD-dependent aldehyde dehydrogenase
MTVHGEDLVVGAASPVTNPATGEVFAHAPAASPDDLNQIFASSASAFEEWRRDERRRDALRRAADALDPNGPWGMHEYTDLQVIAEPARPRRKDVVAR